MSWTAHQPTGSEHRMTRAVTDRPTDAEVIATACRRAGSAMLAVESPVEPSQSALHSHEADLATPTQVDLVHLFDTQAFVLVPTAGPAMRAACLLYTSPSPRD